MLGGVALAAAGGLGGLGGCASEQPTYAGQRPPSILVPGGVPLPVPGLPGRPVAILAPLSGGNAERGAALVRAAQLALGAPGSPMLDVRDTQGTPQGAAAAAQAALAAGARLILGPLTAPETAAVAPVARAAAVPVLAFTTDPAQAQPGVWTLGITPGQQVRRLVGAMVARGKTRFAAVLPDTDFGHAMGVALTQATQQAGAGAPDIRFHGAGNTAIADAMRDVSDFAHRRGAIEDQVRAARDRHDAPGTQLAAQLAQQPVPPAPFDALLLADTGDRLAWLSTFIAYDDLGPPGVRILGPALWALPAARAGASLGDAWYAAPDNAAPARAGFDQAYTDKYGSPPPGLADGAYDAASIARAVAGPDGFPLAALTRPEGFPGVDGPLALDPDGRVRRGLALFELSGGAGSVIEPAPETVPAPGT